MYRLLLIAVFFLPLVRLFLFIFFTGRLLGVVENSIRAGVAEGVALPKKKKEEGDSKACEGEDQLDAGQHPKINLQGREPSRCRRCCVSIRQRYLPFRARQERLIASQI